MSLRKLSKIPAWCHHVLLLGILTSCGSLSSVSPEVPSPTLEANRFTSFDQHPLPYRKWLPEGEIRLIVICIHGISGASNDMENIGEHLPHHLPGTAVYAPDLRGQGNDPLPNQRGDIRRAQDWFADAGTFTKLVRSHHPGVPIVWCGESMGSLIALHACAHQAGRPAPCEALILASPVTSIGAEISTLRRLLLRVASFVLPRYRVTLEGLFGMDQVQITSDEVHQDQVQNNPWHLSSFTLRLLRTIERLIVDLPKQAAEVRIPVLLLHGGRDVFSDPAEIEHFASTFPPEARVTRQYYPESHHLLFYDRQREQVLDDTTRWLRDLRLTPGK